MNDLMAYILGSGLPKQADGLCPVAQDAQAEPAVANFREHMASMLPSDMPDQPAESVPIDGKASDDTEQPILQQAVDVIEVPDSLPLTLQVEEVSQRIPGQLGADPADTDQIEEDVMPAGRITPMAFDIESGENESRLHRTVMISEPLIDAAKETQRVSPDIVQDNHAVIPDVTVLGQQSGKILPVELQVDVVESIEDRSERDEIRKIVESAKVEIHVAERPIPDKNPISITADPLPRHSTQQPQPAITIRLEADGKTMALPVTLDETQTEGRLTLRIDDQGKARLSGPVREMIDGISRADTAEKVMKRAEVTIARVIHVSQPERLLKELSPKSIARDNVIDIRPANGETPRSISPTLESGTRTDLDSGRHGYGRTDKRGVSLTRIDIAKQTVSQDASIEKLVKKIELHAGTETSDRQSQIPTAKDVLPVGKLMIFAQEVVKPPEMPARPLFETVKFKIQLPDSGLKITEISTFKINIKPESLGSMRVHLIVVDNNLTARIDVESVAARNVVENNLNTLRDTLAQQGIRVESFSVNIADGGTRNNGSRNGAPVKKGKYVREVESFEDSPVTGISTSLSSTGNNLTGSLSLVA
jgi:hypothetical protein